VQQNAAASHQAKRLKEKRATTAEPVIAPAAVLQLPDRGSVRHCLGFRGSKLAGQLAHHSLELLAQDVRINRCRSQHRPFHFHCGGGSLASTVREGDNVAPTVRGAADPGDVSVGFQPAERLAHRLRLDADILGQLRLSHWALGCENLDGNDTGVGQSDSAEFFVPGVFYESGRGGKQAPSGPVIHIRHTSSIAKCRFAPVRRAY